MQATDEEIVDGFSILSFLNYKDLESYCSYDISLVDSNEITKHTKLLQKHKKTWLPTRVGAQRRSKPNLSQLTVAGRRHSSSAVPLLTKRARLDPEVYCSPRRVLKPQNVVGNHGQSPRTLLSPSTVTGQERLLSVSSAYLLSPCLPKSVILPPEPADSLSYTTQTPDPSPHQLSSSAPSETNTAFLFSPPILSTSSSFNTSPHPAGKDHVPASLSAVATRSITISALQHTQISSTVISPSPTLSSTVPETPICSPAISNSALPSPIIQETLISSSILSRSPVTPPNTIHATTALRHIHPSHIIKDILSISSKSLNSVIANEDTLISSHLHFTTPEHPENGQKMADSSEPISGSPKLLLKVQEDPEFMEAISKSLQPTSTVQKDSGSSEHRSGSSEFLQTIQKEAKSSEPISRSPQPTPKIRKTSKASLHGPLMNLRGPTCQKETLESLMLTILPSSLSPKLQEHLNVDSDVDCQITSVLPPPPLPLPVVDPQMPCLTPSPILVFPSSMHCGTTLLTLPPLSPAPEPLFRAISALSIHYQQPPPLPRQRRLSIISMPSSSGTRTRCGRKTPCVLAPLQLPALSKRLPPNKLLPTSQPRQPFRPDRMMRSSANFIPRPLPLRVAHRQTKTQVDIASFIAVHGVRPISSNVWMLPPHIIRPTARIPCHSFPPIFSAPHHFSPHRMLPHTTISSLSRCIALPKSHLPVNYISNPTF